MLACSLLTMKSIFFLLQYKNILLLFLGLFVYVYSTRWTYLQLLSYFTTLLNTPTDGVVYGKVRIFHVTSITVPMDAINSFQTVVLILLCVFFYYKYLHLSIQFEIWWIFFKICQSDNKKLWDLRIINIVVLRNKTNEDKIFASYKFKWKKKTFLHVHIY